MKKFNLLIFAVIGIILLTYCGCNTGQKKTRSILHNGIDLSVESGEYWLGKMKVFIFSVSRTPQMAAWIESDHGDYVTTIIVTNKNARKKWMNAPKDGRPEALPVWNNKIKNNSAQIDSVTSATSKKGVNVEVDNSSLLNGREYSVYLEINHSFDYNDQWTENNSGVNGQPSLIYHAKFIKGVPGITELKPIGYGSVDGSDGDIVNKLDGMTTALKIIKNAYIIVD